MTLSLMAACLLPPHKRAPQMFCLPSKTSSTAPTTQKSPTMGPVNAPSAEEPFNAASQGKSRPNDKSPITNGTMKAKPRTSMNNAY